MNTRTLITIAVIALVALGGYFLISNRAAAPTPIENEAATTSAPILGEEEPMGDPIFHALVEYTNDGFSPETVNIKVGETVRFVNNSDFSMWVGADEHPTHTSYDGTATSEHCANGLTIGGAFDMCRPAVAAEFWEFTFTKEGTFDYHNHTRASHGGTIVVTP